jgi:hypothetical protein
VTGGWTYLSSNVSFLFFLLRRPHQLPCDPVLSTLFLSGAAVQGLRAQRFGISPEQQSNLLLMRLVSHPMDVRQ